MNTLFQRNQPHLDKKTMFFERLLSLEGETKVTHCKRKTYFFKVNERSSRVFYLKEGRVKLSVTDRSGKELTKRILHKGELFGESALMGAKRLNTAQALEDCVVQVIPVQVLLDAMQHNHDLSKQLILLLGERMLQMEKRLESYVFKDARTRIFDFLHQWAVKRGKRVGYETLVPKFLPHREIGSLTETSRQTVTTALNYLRRENIVTFNRRRLLIRDMDQLAKVAQA